MWVKPLVICLLGLVIELPLLVSLMVYLGGFHIQAYGVLSIPIFIAVLIFIVSKPVSARLQRLRDEVVGSPVDACVIVHGVMQMPGYISLDKEFLVLTPVLGEAVHLPLEQLAIVARSSWFNGKWYPGQQGIWLNQNSISERIGILPDNVSYWMCRLSRQAPIG